MVLNYRDREGKHEVELASGLQDDFEVFREGQSTYVLSWNDGLGYVGIERFEASLKAKCSSRTPRT